METEESPIIKVNQCIFGYNNGHRLLASSSKFISEIEFPMLVYSDLNPGTFLKKDESYWSGLPLSFSKQYALMKTWAAPEMSRPGCVWTHVLLITFADIARFEDFGVLKRLFHKPDGALEFEKYNKIIELSESDLHEKSNNDFEISESRLLELIRAVYDKKRKISLYGKVNDFENEIFRLWSQQWPSLRRNFSFRNAGGDANLLGSVDKFDLQIIHAEGINSSVVENYNPTKLEDLIISDILNRSPAEFRRFMWRYGADAQIGKDVFYQLAEVYLYAINIEDKNSEIFFEKIAECFKNPNEGLILKDDLISVEKNQYSLIPSLDPIESIFFLMHKESLNVGFRDSQIIPLIQWLWVAERNELLNLINQSEGTNTRIRNLIISEIIRLIAPQELFSLTADFSALRKELIIQNPEFLDNEYLIEISEEELFTYFDLEDLEMNLINRMLIRLLPKDSNLLVYTLFARFPNEVTKNALSFLNQQQINWNAWRTWISVITRDVNWFFSNGFLESLTSKTAITLVAQSLGLENEGVFKIGPKPWIDILKITEDEVVGGLRDYLNLFLIILSLRNPQRGVEYFFEYAFESLHSRILNNNLSYEEWNILSRNLPLPHWWQLWDLGSRLRAGLVDTYVWSALDKRSFFKVVSDKKLMKDLIEIALDSKKGKKYLKKED
ncbi:hypothetical protein [Leptospira santarosai]|uniref:GAP1-N1 domain-containing protein n=2 Tax=Leptospira santarosai TaxID=28183 RepID=UPI0011159493|nr:hypothetical protein [Leptospira santarosai]